MPRTFSLATQKVWDQVLSLGWGPKSQKLLEAVRSAGSAGISSSTLSHVHGVCFGHLGMQINRKMKRAGVNAHLRKLNPARYGMSYENPIVLAERNPG